jgi:hypothetical protein
MVPGDPEMPMEKQYHPRNSLFVLKLYPAQQRRKLEIAQNLLENGIEILLECCGKHFTMVV